MRLIVCLPGATVRPGMDAEASRGWACDLSAGTLLALLETKCALKQLPKCNHILVILLSDPQISGQTTSSWALCGVRAFQGRQSWP